MRILLGPAGSPAGSTLEGIAAVKRLGLQAMEVEFVRGVRMSPELAGKVGEERRKHGIALSVHAPYYINLASEDEKKTEDSKKRILDSCERAHLMGASPVVFHPGYYGKRSREETYEIIKSGISEIQDTVKENRWRAALAPEVMGRLSQFGDFDETISLAKELDCALCIDICHIYARNLGRINYEEIFSRLEELKRALHFHFSGVKYGLKGEISHQVLNSNPSFEGFAKRLLESGFDATIISESPITWEDSLKMKNTLEKLGHRF